MFRELSQKFDKTKGEKLQRMGSSLTDLKHAEEHFTTTEIENLEKMLNLKNQLNESREFELSC